jgi:microcystin-dependent protein
VADDRPADTTTDAVAGLQAQVDDLKSTLLARVSRCPTGTIEPTILTAAKADTLIMNGASVSRTDYPVLWQWVQDNSLIVAGLFTVGDGSTTFGLPDFRGQAVIGAGTLAVGAKVGADSVTLSIANLPSHGHSVSVANHDQHDHAVGGHTHSTGAAGGNHGFHNVGSVTEASALAGSQDHFFSVAADTGGGNAAHSHSVGTAGDDVFLNSVSPHVVTQTAVGSGTAFDNRPASIAVNWLIWT